jgi:phosphoglucosamine mutase
VAKPSLVENHPAVESLLEEYRKRLNGKGRLVLRPSGTEPVVRVMMEGEDEKEISAMARECADRVGSCFAL